MKQQVQIEFQGMKPAQSLRHDIAERVAALESRYGRITSCRVALRAPNPRHRVGGLYDVNIRLALPDGREVNVARTATADERHSDLAFAINDAFKRARRRLQDRVRRMQGEVKAHGEPSIGTVTKLDLIDEIGFIETSDGREIYFHPNAVRNGGVSKLKQGARVTFHEEAGRKGPQASTVRLLGKHKLK
jgi:cold shock CspA family protein/ribosome-associated translation inhibitor RaiA